MGRELTKNNVSIPAEQCGHESLLRKFLPPHFFTPKVVENRAKGRAYVPTQPKAESRWKSVARKLNGKTTHIELHLKQDNHSFYFKCPVEGISRKVEHHRLMMAIAPVHGSPWVTMTVDTQVFTLNRAELLSAVNDLSKED